MEPLLALLPREPPQVQMHATTQLVLSWTPARRQGAVPAPPLPRQQMPVPPAHSGCLHGSNSYNLMNSQTMPGKVGWDAPKLALRPAHTGCHRGSLDASGKVEDACVLLLPKIHHSYSRRCECKAIQADQRPKGQAEGAPTLEQEESRFHRQSSLRLMTACLHVSSRPDSCKTL